jgi:hypothetical protein
MLKLGRKPRMRDARVPHFSALAAGVTLPPPPASVDYLSAMPSDLGMFLNDTYGDCTCAGLFHALQIWQFNANNGNMQPNTDADVLSVYETFCGFDPSNPATDQGGIEQTVLTDWMNKGIPTASTRNQLTAFVEIDPRNTDDIKRVIDSCAVCYIGIQVPSSLFPPNAPPPQLWRSKYSATWEFLAHYMDEAYAIIDADWVMKTGKTPLGMTLADLSAQMNALKD